MATAADSKPKNRSQDRRRRAARLRDIEAEAGSGNGSKTRPRRKPQREDLKPGEVLCTYCTAKCCRYFALPIDVPTRWKDFEYIRWYLLHDRAAVFVEDAAWYLLIHTRCRRLGDDNLCTAYEVRPQVCRDYTTDVCEYEDDWVYEQYFETPEQVEEYAEAVLGPRNGRSHRSPKPDPLKVVSG